MKRVNRWDSAAGCTSCTNTPYSLAFQEAAAGANAVRSTEFHNRGPSLPLVRMALLYSSTPSSFRPRNEV
eukprot:8620957-Lingulodinium_polyedra.AAC.1